MTKARKKIVNPPTQRTLFDLLVEAREQHAPPQSGRMNVSGQLQAAIRNAIRHAPKSRESIAQEMTDLSGITISVHQVNNWTAESHPHRVPAELLPAFCQATGSIEPIRILGETAGVFTLPGPDALRAEIKKLDEETRRLNREKRKRELFLKEMEQ